MPPSDLDAGMVGGDERQRDTDILAAAEMVVGIEQAEGKPEQRGFGRKRNVALVPVEQDTERVPSLMLPARDDANVAHRGGVGSRERAGQRKARDLLAPGETRQEV